jgi:DNA repair protein RadA/Sms
VFEWQGQCHECGAWNSLAEEIALQDKVAAVGVTGYAGVEAQLTRLGEVACSEHVRHSTGIREFDHYRPPLPNESIVLLHLHSL